MGVLADSWFDLVHGGSCVGCARPGRALCHGCRALLPRRGYAVHPSPPPDGLLPCFAAGEYAGLLGALVVAHKERSAFALCRPLGQALAVAVASATGDGPVPRVALVPVPSRPAVVRARGHDPTRRMAHRAAAILRRGGHDVAVWALLGQRFGVTDQAGLDRARRAANLAGSMHVRPAARAALARSLDVSTSGSQRIAIVLCDDVLTTGATAREAQRALEDAGLAPRAMATVAATRLRSSLRGS